MEIIKIVLEGKPVSVNSSYKPRRGKMYLSEEAKEYGRSVGWQAKSQFLRYKKPILTQDLEVTYIYFFPQYEKFDHLNANKKLNDALENIIWRNDKQIKVSHHYTQYDSKKPRIELYIKKIHKVYLPLWAK